VSLPEEASNASTALRLADHRMYAQKNTKDSSAKQQLRDHAMTSDRPYRRGIGEEAAVTELERGAGTQFDPAVIEAFVAELAARPHEAEEPITPAPPAIAA